MQLGNTRGEAGRADGVGLGGAARVGRGCPISNFSLYAVAISDPKACSVGLAVIPHIREATPIDPPAQPFSPGWVTSLGALGRRGLSILLLTKRDQLGGDLLRKGAQRLPCVRSLHVLEHGASDDREAVNLCQRLGNVCRA